MTSIYSPKCLSQFTASILLTASLLLCWATPGSAQYLITDLVSNQNAIGSNPADLDLVNTWGVTLLATSPFWVSDNGTGKSTLYNSVGQKQGLVVTIPPASGTGLGTPTGVIGNTASSFAVSITQGGVTKSGKAIFLFATQDGTISGWNPAVLPTTAVIAVDSSNFGASYTALTMFTNSLGTSFLYAANNVDGGGIDMFNADFTFLQTFSDPQIPQKFAPYGIRVIKFASVHMLSVRTRSFVVGPKFFAQRSPSSFNFRSARSRANNPARLRDSDNLCISPQSSRNSRA